MVTRRMIRSGSKLAAIALFVLLTVFLLDRNFRLLPNAVHEYMPHHHDDLLAIDVAVTTCSSINVFSSCKLDDRWHRVEKDLYLGQSWVYSAYIHVRYKKEEELTDADSVVMDVTVGRLDPSSGSKDKADQVWETRSAGLWILRSSQRTAGDNDNAVTGVDVLFGDDAVEVRSGWKLQGTPLLLHANSNSAAAHVTIRRRGSAQPPKIQPRIKDNGRFKIMQLADLHLSTGVGHCRDPVPDEYDGGPCMADPRTLDFVEKLLEEEKPDMVVLSGDQVNGDTAPDAQSPIFKYASLLIKRKIPYVSIFGNHDDEESLSRAKQMAIIEQLPYSLSEAGPDDIDGVGNYVIEVLAPHGSAHSALTLYMLDSHSYSPDERHYHGYDWIKQNQIDWFKHTSSSLKKKHKEYTHFHIDVAFIHIPLPEYTSRESDFVGGWLEGVTAPKFNTRFRDALVEQGVAMVSCGHDHANDYCMLSKDETTKKPELWMCYGGGAGFGGYGGYGDFIRRVRFFEFDMNVGRVVTYKRLEYGNTQKRLDEQTIVDRGRAVPMEKS